MIGSSVVYSNKHHVFILPSTPSFLLLLLLFLLLGEVVQLDRLKNVVGIVLEVILEKSL